MKKSLFYESKEDKEMRSILHSKRGAIELSMTTVVIIVLSMTMLILGLTLVRTVFTSAKNAVDLTDAQVRDQIKKLFVQEDQRSAIYLTEQKASIKQGEAYSIAFGIRNVGNDAPFTYTTKLVSKNCVRDDPMKWFALPPSTSEPITIAGGGVFSNRLALKPSDTAELCLAQFRIEVKKDNVVYDTPTFLVEVTAKGLL